MGAEAVIGLVERCRRQDGSQLLDDLQWGIGVIGPNENHHHAVDVDGPHLLDLVLALAAADRVSPGRAEQRWMAVVAGIELDGVHAEDDPLPVVPAKADVLGRRFVARPLERKGIDELVHGGRRILGPGGRPLTGLPVDVVLATCEDEKPRTVRRRGAATGRADLAQES